MFPFSKFGKIQESNIQPFKLPREVLRNVLDSVNRKIDNFSLLLISHSRCLIKNVPYILLK